MPLAQILQTFKDAVAQCDSLIANAHKVDANGTSILPVMDQQQITTAAFLNLFIAWESFLESSVTDFMIGTPTITGTQPVRFVSPPTLDAANAMVIGGVMQHFDFAKHEYVRRSVAIFFRNGYPFEPHLTSILNDLEDLRKMRNACAHISSTTRTALESLALRIFGQPQTGITVYRMLTAVDPRSGNGNTVFVTYRDKLLVTAELIARG